MSRATIRITGKTYKLLQEIKTASGESMQSVVEKALESYKEKKFWREVNNAFINLKNSKDHRNELKERKLWDNTLSDGI